MSLQVMVRRTVTAALASGFMLVSVACVSAAPPRVYVRVAPPPPIVEVRAVAPAPGYVWVGGYHRWDGRAYVWIPGRWAAPPRRRAIWVEPHWSRDRRGWYFVDGHWR